MDASAPPKVHQSIPRSIWFLACRGRAVLILIGWALLSCHPFVYVKPLLEHFANTYVDHWSPVNFKCSSSRHSNFLCPYNWMWPRIVALSSVHESAKVWAEAYMLLFLIDRVSNWSRSPLTSADCYRCSSLISLFSSNFPKSAAPHKH